MNGGISPFIVVERITKSDTNATAIPSTYMPYVIKSAWANPKASAMPPEIAVKIGSFAPQEKNGITRMVATRSCSSARVRVLIIAGTEQPNPIIIGINALPDTPNLRKILSKINATRAIYPLSSKMENSKNNTKIWGRKLSTENSPPSTPSAISPIAHSLAPAFSKPRTAKSPNADVPTSNKLNSITPGEFSPPAKNTAFQTFSLSAPHHSPNAGMIDPKYRKSSENVIWNTANKITKNRGIPAHLFVSTLSTLSERVNCPFSYVFARFSVGENRSTMYLYRASAISASGSAHSPTFNRIKSCTAFASSGWLCISSSSFSTSFTAWNKG